jgi:hypothetical protein
MRAQEFVKEYVNKDVLQPGWHAETPIRNGELTLKASVKSDEYLDNKPRLWIEICDHQNRRVAFARFNVHGLFSKALKASMVHVDDEYRRQGIATIIYNYVHNLGNTIKPSFIQLGPGKEMWKGFKKKGVQFKENFGTAQFRPMPLKLGQYRGPYDPRTMQPYPAEYKSSLDLMEIVDQLIDNHIEPKVVTVSPKQLIATQDWLSDGGSNEPAFPAYTDLPVVLKHNNQLYLLDGHHRSSKALKQGSTVSAYMFDSQDLSN